MPSHIQCTMYIVPAAAAASVTMTTITFCGVLAAAICGATTSVVIVSRAIACSIVTVVSTVIVVSIVTDIGNCYINEMICAPCILIRLMLV